MSSTAKRERKNKSTSLQMSNPSLPSDGTLSLSFSCWDNTLLSDESDDDVSQREQDVFEWLAQSVFCKIGSSAINSNPIHLMDPLVFESVCEDDSYSQNINFWSDTIVWNIPDAEVDQRTLRVVGYDVDAFNYTIWNVSFPTYRWGEPNMQRKLQRSFEALLREDHDPQEGLYGCKVAVVGREQEFWLSQRITLGEKEFLFEMGAVLIVLQTLITIIFHFVIRKIAQRSSRRK